MFQWLKSLFLGEEISDVPNEVTGLSPRDVINVQSSWSTVYDNKVAFGIDIFLRLFTKDPETKTFFKSFMDVDIADLPKKPQFKAHIINFMNGFNTIIAELNNIDVATALCTKIGNNHAARAIKQEHFEETREILMHLLRVDLKLDDAKLTSWERFINFMYKNIYAELANEIE